MNDRDFSTRLTAEVDQWVVDGIIDSETAARVISRYPSEQDNRRSRAGGLIALLGALLMGAGAIAFIASNWSAISPLAKLAILITFLVCTAAGGYRLRFGTSRLTGTGGALLFLTTPLYGACIFLTASSFQMPIDTPELLFIWAAGVLPVAIICESKAQWLVALMILITAIGWTATIWMQETVPWILVVLFCFGIILHAGGLLLGRYPVTQPFQQITRVSGLLVVQLTLIPLGFAKLMDGIDTHGVRGATSDGLLIPTAVVVTAAALICVAAFHVTAKAAEDRIQLGLYLLGLGGVASPIFIVAITATVWSVFVNILMLIMVIALIIQGVHERDAVAINVAILSFVTQIACRYSELFWGQIPPEVFFTILGLMLLVGGMLLERGRKRLISGMGAEPSLRVRK
jgi:uncharacterized membrane protein